MRFKENKRTTKTQKLSYRQSLLTAALDSSSAISWHIDLSLEMNSDRLCVYAYNIYIIIYICIYIYIHQITQPRMQSNNFCIHSRIIIQYTLVLFTEMFCNGSLMMHPDIAAVLVRLSLCLCLCLPFCLSTRLLGFGLQVVFTRGISITVVIRFIPFPGIFQHLTGQS